MPRPRQSQHRNQRQQMCPLNRLFNQLHNGSVTLQHQRQCQQVRSHFILQLSRHLTMGQRRPLPVYGHQLHQVINST